MKKTALFLLLFTLVFVPITLSAYPERSYGNDTLIDKEDDANDLMKYLKGTWKVKGSWQIIEGEGKVKYTTRAVLSGTETYAPVLNGHFLQRDLSSTVSYYSRDYGKKLSNNFKALTLYTYNENLNSFFFWYYDSTGGFLDAKGSFYHTENEYSFDTHALNDKGEAIEMRHIIRIIDPNQYEWEVKQKGPQDYEWELAASGSSTRKGKA